MLTGLRKSSTAVLVSSTRGSYPVARSVPSSCSSRVACRIRCFASDDAPKKRAGKKKKGGAGQRNESGGRSRELEQVLAALDAPVRKEPPVSEEERERRYEIGRNYLIGKFEEHNALHHDLACKIQLKKHAMKMLPRNTKLREEALKVDDSSPPLWRSPPTWTPPIPDFDPSEFIDKGD